MSDHFWMWGRTEALPKAPTKMSKEETIREWYDRTTIRMRRALMWAAVAAAVGGTILWCLAGFGVLARIQTFQGAFTIPVVGGIWLLSFVFIFLVPSREVSFRSMESLERMERRVEEAVEGRINPIVAVWTRIGERLEREIPALVEEGKAFLAGARAAVAKLEAASDRNEQALAEAKPMIEALRRVQERIENEHIVDEVKEAARSIRAFTAPAPPPHPSVAPQIGWARSVLNKGDGR